jgi:hypothetical protein
MLSVDINHGVVQEALLNMGQKFETIDHWGPTAVANFYEIEDADERLRIKRRTFEVVQDFLNKTLRSKES